MGLQSFGVSRRLTVSNFVKNRGARCTHAFVASMYLNWVSMAHCMCTYEFTTCRVRLNRASFFTFSFNMYDTFQLGPHRSYSKAARHAHALIFNGRTCPIYARTPHLIQSNPSFIPTIDLTVRGNVIMFVCLDERRKELRCRQRLFRRDNVRLCSETLRLSMSVDQACESP